MKTFALKLIKNISTSQYRNKNVLVDSFFSFAITKTIKIKPQKKKPHKYEIIFKEINKTKPKKKNNQNYINS